MNYVKESFLVLLMALGAFIGLYTVVYYADGIDKSFLQHQAQSPWALMTLLGVISFSCFMAANPRFATWVRATIRRIRNLAR